MQYLRGRFGSLVGKMVSRKQVKCFSMKFSLAIIKLKKNMSSSTFIVVIQSILDYINNHIPSSKYASLQIFEQQSEVEK